MGFRPAGGAEGGGATGTRWCGDCVGECAAEFGDGVGSGGTLRPLLAAGFDAAFGPARTGTAAVAACIGSVVAPREVDKVRPDKAPYVNGVFE